MRSVKKHKKTVIVLLCLAVLVAVSFMYPEHAETVARALMLVIGAL